MAVQLIDNVGRRFLGGLDEFGRFCKFVGRTLALLATVFRRRSLRELMSQAYEIGVKSTPVVGITGAFIGAVLGVESYTQFKAIGQESRLGAVINLSVVKQIGPVLTAVMLAGRVGGALTAELGTMNVTEQLDALRVMGADPVVVLVAPRVWACILLSPLLTIYSDVMGMLGGWLISVKVMGVSATQYWDNSALSVDTWQVMEGLVKSMFFGGAIALIACYKGFTSGSGASGVGRACTEAFVQAFIAIIILNFVFAQVAKNWYAAIYGTKSIFS